MGSRSSKEAEAEAPSAVVTQNTYRSAPWLELYRIPKIRTREPRVLSVFSQSGSVNWFFRSSLGLLKGLLAKRPVFIGLQLSKLAKDPDSQILRTRIRHSPNFDVGSEELRRAKICFCSEHRATRTDGNM